MCVVWVVWSEDCASGYIRRYLIRLFFKVMRVQNGELLAFDQLSLWLEIEVKIVLELR